MKRRAANLRPRERQTAPRCFNCAQTMNPVILLRHVLRHRAIQEISESIEAFEALAVSELDNEQLDVEIRRVLMAYDEANKRGVLLLPSSVIPHKKGSLFSRVRRLTDRDLLRMQTEGVDEQRDCYEPPEDERHVIGPGRLNHAGERILYTAYGGAGWATMACFEELEIEANEWFMIVEYEATASFTAATIGPERFAPLEVETHLDDEERKKCEILSSFVRSKFQQRIARGDDYLYRVTRLIAREFTPGERRNEDIWQYPSVARDGGWNVAFDPVRKDKLRVKSVKIAKCLAYNKHLGARLIQITYDAISDPSDLNRRTLFAGAGPQAYYALTYPSRAEKRLDQHFSYTSRVDPAQNERLKHFKRKLVLFAETNNEGGVYIAAREAA